MIDILDSEVATITQVWQGLQGRTYKSHEYNAFDREIRERFAEAGFVVKVNWYETNLAEVKMPEIDIVGRIEEKEFDHDQMRHEVVNNLLGLPSQDAGIIKTNGLWTGAQAAEAHKHGAGCGH